MITRRQGREWALQALVQCELNPPPPGTSVEAFVTAALEDFWALAFSVETERKEESA